MSSETAVGETPALPAAPQRDSDGRYLPGQSGNPRGRPLKDSRHHLTQLKHKLDIAVRENLPVERLCKILNKVADEAEKGNMRAAKLILDKFVSNADNAAVEDEGDVSRKVVFVIENATFAAATKNLQPALPAIDVEVVPALPNSSEESS